MFQLFFPYPFTGIPIIKERNPFLLASLQQPIINDEETVCNPVEMLQHCFRFYNGSNLRCTFEDSFVQLRQNMLYQGIVPYLYQIPEAVRFQRTRSLNVNKLLAEIERFGAYLSTDQTVFHGGDFTVDDVASFGMSPLSTTFNPHIAIWHAYYDGIGKWNRSISAEPLPPVNPAVLVLTVGTTFVNKALIYRKGGPSMADEMEALLAPNFIITPTKVWIYPGYYNVTIIEAVLRSRP